MAHLSFQFRAYPLREQLPILDRWLANLNSLWNHAVEVRTDAWQKEQRRVSFIDTEHMLTDWRAWDEEHHSNGLSEMPVHIEQDQLARLDLAFQAFFCRWREGKRGKKAGYPKFHHDGGSFSFVPAVKSTWEHRPDGTHWVKVPRLGSIPVKYHRDTPQGEPKFITVQRRGDKWFVTLQYEVPDAPPPTVPLGNPVGVDLGLDSLATLSTGEKIEPPKFLRMAEKRLARAQRKLSRRKKGSGRRERQKAIVARCHEKVRNQRKWFAHQLSHDWAEGFDLVAFEDMAVPEMVHTNLAQPIHDAGWGMLRQMTDYKLAQRSKWSVQVDARNTTQTCHKCGKLSDPALTLKDRIIECPCGYEGDRDINAAQNILARGMNEVRRRTAEQTRGESLPTLRRAGRRAYQRRRADSKNRESTTGPEAIEPTTYGVGSGS
jgi:putative transposase